MTRSRVTLESAEVLKIKAYNESGMRIPLFIKKSAGEGTDFYYMGDMEPIDFIQTEIDSGEGKMLPIVNIIFGMKDEVEDSIYQYLES